VLSLADLARVAGQDLDAASRATRVSTATMKNIDAIVLKTEHEFATRFGFERNPTGRGFRSYLRHKNCCETPCS